jgi:DHA1 family bicyclomycin/chloramphenicol resistance-like MFS transporter
VLDPDRAQAQHVVQSDGGHPWRLLALLIAVTSIGPLSLNILTPAMPGMIVSLGADASVVQLTLSLYLAGMAISQLVLGPLSDRFGRRPVLLAGLALTVVASFAALATTSIAGLIVSRTIQAFGATAGIVIGRAVIRDLYDRDRAASMIGWVTMAMVVAPMIAPLIGGALDTAFGWHAIVLFLGLFSAVILAWTAAGLRETHATPSGEGFARFFSDAAILLGDRAFIGYTLVAAFNSAMFFAFIGGAPHVVVTIMRRTSAEYGIWFAIISVAYMAGNFAAGRWSAQYGVDTMVRRGVVITGIGAAVGMILILLQPYGGPIVIATPQFIIAFASGFLLPNAIAGAVSVRPQAAGTAAGITGFMQMGLGALVAQSVGHLIAGAATALPLELIDLVLSGCAMASLALLRK